MTPDPWLTTVLQRPCFHSTDECWLDAEHSVLQPKIEPYVPDHLCGNRRILISLKTERPNLKVGKFKNSKFRYIVDQITFEGDLSLKFGLPSKLKLQSNLTKEDKQWIVSCHRQFHNDRFATDPHLGPDISQLIKKAWLTTAISNQKVILAKDGENRVGFCVFQICQQKSFWSIELIAVNPNYQHKGIATRLIHQVSRYFQIETLSVGTQCHNTAAVALYSKLGLKPKIMRSVWHNTDGTLNEK
jgi:ribosomal protein S18 acetylase RimI-like enzyme